MLLRHFQVFFNIAGKKNYLFLFASKTQKKFPSQEDKIGWFPSQLQSEQPASRTTTILYNVRQHGRGQSLQWGRGSKLLFKLSNFPHQATLEMLENIIDSKTNPSALTKLPVSSSEHLLFRQPARFLWGTDKVRNRFVVCT